MKIGFGAPVAGAWADPHTLARFAQRAEELEYHSLWTFQRLLAPEDLERTAPVYHSVLDPLLSLTYAAARTSRIRLGVALVNLPFVSPTYLAKQAATLDVLSAGRLDLGLGLGWSAEEFTATGATTGRRAARTAEYVQVLRTLFHDEVSTFDGEFYTVPPSRMAPKPVQRPGPPVLLGGVVDAALTRAGRIAEGWMSRSRADLSRIGQQIETVRDGARVAGKDPEAVRIVCRGVVDADAGGRSGGDRPLLAGSFSQIRADADWLAEQGVTELFYDLNYDPRIGDPRVASSAAVSRAEEIMEALAPR